MCKVIVLLVLWLAFAIFRRSAPDRTATAVASKNDRYEYAEPTADLYGSDEYFQVNNTTPAEWSARKVDS